MNNFFPITVTAAIFLFVFKEIVEAYKINVSKKRKVRAIKFILANEIEKNNWVVKSLQRHLKDIENDWDDFEFRVIDTRSGGVRIECIDKENDCSSGAPIFFVSTKVFDSVYLELSVLDNDLFEVASSAYEKVAEVKHIHDSLIEHVHNKEEMIKGFCDYGLKELADSYMELSKLYKACTGKALDGHKLRSFT